MAPDPWEPLHIVGMGADGPRSLAPATSALIASARVLVGGRRHLAWFAAHPADKLVLAGGLGALDQAAAARAAGMRVVVLASGDPGFHGVARRLRERFGRDAVCVHPAVSSVQLAFARAGLSWEDAGILSAHGRDLNQVVRAALAGHEPALAVLTDAANTPPRVASALRDAGMGDCRAVVGQRLGAEDESVVEMTLFNLAATDPDAFDPLNVLVLDRPQRPLPADLGMSIGRPDAAYVHTRGMITKAEVRAIGLSRLALRRTDTLWDIGAGCGSVGIEAAALVPGGAVWALERDPAQLAHLRTNLDRHRARNVTAVAGQAPADLAALPDPDAIFLGGSGGHLDEILGACAARLRPQGRLVAHLVLVEHLATFRAWALTLGWPHDLIQVAISRGETLGGAVRFAALNPVWVVRVVKPA